MSQQGVNNEAGAGQVGGAHSNSGEARRSRLESLPMELRVMIASNLDRYSQMSLAQVSRRILPAARQAMYQDLAVAETQVCLLAPTIIGSNLLAGAVTNLEVKVVPLVAWDRIWPQLRVRNLHDRCTHDLLTPWGQSRAGGLYLHQELRLVARNSHLFWYDMYPGNSALSVIDFCHNVDAELFLMLTVLPNLRRLVVDRHYQTSMHSTATAWRTQTETERLALSRVTNAPGLVHCLPRLQELELRSSWDELVADPELLSSLFSSPSWAAPLAKLTLTKYAFDSAMFAPLVSANSIRYESLTTLSLLGCLMTADELKVFLAAFPNLDSFSWVGRNPLHTSAKVLRKRPGRPFLDAVYLSAGEVARALRRSGHNNLKRVMIRQFEPERAWNARRYQRKLLRPGAVNYDGSMHDLDMPADLSFATKLEDLTVTAACLIGLMHFFDVDASQPPPRRNFRHPAETMSRLPSSLRRLQLVYEVAFDNRVFTLPWSWRSRALNLAEGAWFDLWISHLQDLFDMARSAPNCPLSSLESVDIFVPSRWARLDNLPDNPTWPHGFDVPTHLTFRVWEFDLSAQHLSAWQAQREFPEDQRRSQPERRNLIVQYN